MLRTRANCGFLLCGCQGRFNSLWTNIRITDSEGMTFGYVRSGSLNGEFFRTRAAKPWFSKRGSLKSLPRPGWDVLSSRCRKTTTATQPGRRSNHHRRGNQGHYPLPLSPRCREAASRPCTGPSTRFLRESRDVIVLETPVVKMLWRQEQLQT